MKQYFNIKAIFSLFAIISANLVYGLWTSDEKEALALGEKLPLSIGMSGTLIDSRVVLTSASMGNPKVMLFGPENKDLYVVIKSIKHPKWKQGEIGYDFQLLFLDRPVLNVQPIQRARVGSGALDNKKVLVAGTSLLEKTPDFPLYLMLFEKLQQFLKNPGADEAIKLLGFKSAGYNVIKTQEIFPQLLILSNSEANPGNIFPTAAPKPVDKGAGIFLVEGTPGENAKYQLVGVASPVLRNATSEELETFNDVLGGLELPLSSSVVGNVTDPEVNTWIDNEIIKEALSAKILTNEEIKERMKELPKEYQNQLLHEGKLISGIRPGGTLIDASWYLTYWDKNRDEKGAIRLNGREREFDSIIRIGYSPLALLHLTEPVTDVAPFKRARLEKLPELGLRYGFQKRFKENQLSLLLSNKDDLNKGTGVFLQLGTTGKLQEDFFLSGVADEYGKPVDLNLELNTTIDNIIISAALGKMVVPPVIERKFTWENKLKADNFDTLSKQEVDANILIFAKEFPEDFDKLLDKKTKDKDVRLIVYTPNFGRYMTQNDRFIYQDHLKDEVDFGNPSLLLNFLKWSSRFPAKKTHFAFLPFDSSNWYDLVNHDEVKLPQLSEIFKNALDGKKLGILLLGNQGGACYETLDQIKDYAEVLLASQFKNSFENWNAVLEKFVEDISNSTKENSIALAKKIIDTAELKKPKNFSADDEGISAVSTKLCENLNPLLKKFVQEIEKLKNEGRLNDKDFEQIRGALKQTYSSYRSVRSADFYALIDYFIKYLEHKIEAEKIVDNRFAELIQLSREILDNLTNPQDGILDHKEQNVDQDWLGLSISAFYEEEDQKKELEQAYQTLAIHKTDWQKFVEIFSGKIMTEEEREEQWRLEQQKLLEEEERRMLEVFERQKNEIKAPAAITHAGVLIDTNWFLTTSSGLSTRYGLSPAVSLDNDWNPTSGTVKIADHDYDFDKIYSVQYKEWRLLHLKNPVVNETPIGRARLTESMISEVPKKFAYVLEENWNSKETKYEYQAKLVPYNDQNSDQDIRAGFPLFQRNEVTGQLKLLGFYQGQNWETHENKYDFLGEEINTWIDNVIIAEALGQPLKLETVFPEVEKSKEYEKYAKAKTSWNLLVYQYSKEDIDRYAELTKGTDIRILLQEFDWGYVSRYLIQDGKILYKQKTENEIGITDPKLLGDFLNWAFLFPSERKSYALNGTGQNWYNLIADNGVMTLDQFSKELGGRKFDFMFLGEPGAQTFEVLDQLKGNTDILIASQEKLDFPVVPSLIEGINEAPNAATIEIGKNIVEKVKVNYQERQDYEEPLILSAVATKDAAQLGKWLNQLAVGIRRLKNGDTFNNADLEEIKNKIKTIYSDKLGESADILQLSESTLGFLENTIKNNENLNNAIEACRQIKELLPKMVVENLTEKDKSKLLNGLSITYYPVVSLYKNTLPELKKIYPLLEVGKDLNKHNYQTRWLDFIEFLYNAAK